MDDAELFACLRPWHAALRKCYFYGIHDTTPLPPPLSLHDDHDDAVDTTATRVLWLAPAHIGHVAEALDLLALMAPVRPTAVRYAIAQLWPKSLVGWLDDEGAAVAPPPFVLGLSVDVRSRDYLAPLADWLTGFHTLSDDYARVQSNIKSTALYDHVNASVLAVPIRVRCTTQDPYSDDAVEIDRINAIVHTLVPLVMLQRRDGNDETATAARFEIRHVAFQQLDMVVNVQTLCYMGRLADWGVTFNHLPAVRESEPTTTTQCSVSLVRALHRLLAVPGQASPVSRGVTTLAVFDVSPRHITKAVLTAAQASATLQRLRVLTCEDPDDADLVDRRARMWDYVAYVALSRHANPGLRKLDPDFVHLTRDIFRSMERIQAAEDPITELMFHWGSEPRPTHWLSAVRFRLDDPDRDTESKHAVLTVETPLDCRALIAQGSKLGCVDYWGVMLPGCGIAWVHRDDATPIVATEISTTTCGVTELCLGSVLADGMNVSSDVIALLGDRLRFIEAESICGGETVDDWYCRMCVSCPLLEHIDLCDTSLADSKTIIDLYASGTCRAKKLRLDGFYSGRSPHHVDRFLDVLGDATHALTQHVQELNLWVQVERDEDWSLLKSLHGMLERNRRLYSVIIYICLEHDLPKPPGAADFHKQFDQYHTQMLAIRTGPLDLQRKLALLSVLQHSSNQSTGWSLPVLDSHVLANIFEFSASHRIRTVTFTLE